MPTSVVANVIIGPGTRVWLKPMTGSLATTLCELRVMKASPKFGVNTAKVGVGKSGNVSQEVATSENHDGSIEAVMESDHNPRLFAGAYCEMWIKNGSSTRIYSCAEVLIKDVSPGFDNDTEKVSVTFNYHCNLAWTDTTTAPS